MRPTHLVRARVLSASLTLAALALPITSSRVAHAEPTPAAHAEPTPAAVEEGRALFSKGVAAFRAGDFRAALDHFDRAYAVAPSFRIQFNIGQTCAELQDHACATKAFERFLADGGKQVPPAQRTTAERELKRLHALVGNVRVVVNVAGADVAIDDAPVGTSPLPTAVIVNAGRRKITATKPPLSPVSSTVEVPAGETVEATLTLVDGTGAPLASSTTTVESDHVGPSRTPFWIGVSTTGALLVGTVIFGALTLGAKSDLDGVVGRFGATSGDIDSARSKVDSLALVTDVFGGLTLVAAGVTTYLFFSTKPPPTQVGVGPRGITLSHTF